MSTPPVPGSTNIVEPIRPYEGKHSDLFLLLVKLFSHLAQLCERSFESSRVAGEDFITKTERCDCDTVGWTIYSDNNRLCAANEAVDK